MIQKFVDRYMEKKNELEKTFSAKHPGSYEDIVRAVVNILHDNNASPDPSRIHEICDGDHHGTLVYVIASGSYEPDDYWYVRISYGSCSGCDLLESIRGFRYDGMPSIEQVKDYMTLALHVVQQLRKMEGETVWSIPENKEV